MLTPEQTAKRLIKEKFPIENYLKVQNARKARLKFWEERGVQTLIEKEGNLIKFGEQVLVLMKEAYGSN